MARYNFGGTSTEWVFTTNADGTMRATGAGLTFWNAQTGGTQYTGLLLGGNSVDAITVPPDGQIPLFQGPDGVSKMWASAGGARTLLVSIEGTVDTAIAAADLGGGGAVASVNAQTGAVVLDLDDIDETATAKKMTAAERTKLTGIATAATANATDAQLRDRSTHTGTQPASTITGLGPAITTAGSAATHTPAITRETNEYRVAGQAVAATIAAPTGSPADGASLLIRIDDNGTARALTWNAIYDPVGATLPTTTEVGKTTYVGARWHAAKTKWQVLASGTAVAGGGAVSSVNTKTGVVVLDMDDIAETTNAKKLTATERTKIAALGTAANVNTGTASGNVPLLGTGGRLDIARIASGTPTGTKFVRDDGTLAEPAGGSGGTATDAIEFVTFPGTLTTGTGTTPLVFPFDINLLGVTASLGTTANADVIADVNVAGTSIYTTQANRPKVTAGALVGTEAVPNTTAITAGSPITFDRDQVGGPANITYVGTSHTEYSGSTTHSLTRPTGSQTGDIHLATIITTSEGGTGTGTTPPGGWTEIGTAQVGADNAGSGELVSRTYWFRDTGAAGPWVFTVSGSTGGFGQLLTYRGCATTGSPVDVFAKAQAGYGTSWATPTVTTTQANDQLVSLFVIDGSIPGTLTPPTGLTRRTTAMIAAADGTKVTAGATGAQTWSSDAARLGIGITIALLADPAYTAPGAHLALALRYQRPGGGGGGTSSALQGGPLCSLVANRWYSTSTGRSTPSIPAEGYEGAAKAVMGRATTLAGIAVNVTTAGSTGAVIRLGIRADNNGMPGTVLWQGTVDATTTGAKTLNPALAVTAGQELWFTATVQGAASTRPTMTVTHDVIDRTVGDTDIAQAFASGHGPGYRAGSVTGTLPDTPSWNTNGSQLTKVIIRTVT